VRAGTLRHRITVTRPLDADETSQNTFGEDQGTPETIGSFWCHVEVLDGRELESAQQRWAEARYRLRLRRQNGIAFTTKMYATWGSKTLNILDVQDPGDAMRPEVVMIARESG
jgi:head-tail adaptor